jgi:hypothetical protein
MTQAEYNEMSYAEKMLIYFDDPPKWFNRYSRMKEIRSFAINESLRLTGQAADIDGTKQNAYQHALWAGTMALEWGYADALAWTNAHEEREPAPSQNVEWFNKSKQMDLRNNAVGLGFYWHPTGSVSDYLVSHQGSLCWLIGTGARAWCP